MKSFLKGKIATTGIVVATVILSGVAVFTAYRLYQFRSKPIAPTAPESVPFAAEPPVPCAQLSFTISAATTTPSPTQPPGTTSTPSPTSTKPSPTKSTTTSTPTPTQPAGTTATPTLTPTTAQIAQTSPTTAVVQEALPDAGVSLPTIITLGFATIIIALALTLAI